MRMQKEASKRYTQGRKCANEGAVALKAGMILARNRDFEHAREHFEQASASFYLASMNYRMSLDEFPSEHLAAKVKRKMQGLEQYDVRCVVKKLNFYKPKPEPPMGQIIYKTGFI